VKSLLIRYYINTISIKQNDKTYTIRVSLSKRERLYSKQISAQQITENRQNDRGPLALTTITKNSGNAPSKTGKKGVHAFTAYTLRAIDSEI